MEWKRYITDLSDEQLKGMAEISRDIAQVCLASIVIPAFIPSFTSHSLPLTLSGAILMLGTWVASIALVKEI